MANEETSRVVSSWMKPDEGIRNSPNCVRAANRRRGSRSDCPHPDSGNTLICEGLRGRIFELALDGGLSTVRYNSLCLEANR